MDKLTLKDLLFRVCRRITVASVITDTFVTLTHVLYLEDDDTISITDVETSQVTNIPSSYEEGIISAILKVFKEQLSGVLEEPHLTEIFTSIVDEPEGKDSMFRVLCSRSPSRDTFRPFVVAFLEDWCMHKLDMSDIGNVIAKSIAEQDADAA